MNLNEIINQKIAFAMGEHQISRIAMQAEIEALRQEIARLKQPEPNPSEPKPAQEDQ